MIKCEFKRVPVDELELDTSNPRIARYVEMYGGNIPDEQMSLALGAGQDVSEGSSTTTFISLRESIKTNGGIIHPIIVSKATDGRLVVIEGNTRTSIYREFKSKSVAGDWSTIPAMVYTGLQQSDIDAIRLQAHLVGPRDWDPYSKAKYLDFLRNSQHLTMEQVVDFCGGRKRDVLDYIDAYQDMGKYYRQALTSDDEFDTTRFSAFVELQKPRIKQAILNHGFTLTDFSRWVIDELIFPLNTVRQLPRILANPKSRSVFLSSGAQEAIKLLEVPAATEMLKDASLEDLSKEISRRVLSMSYGQLQRLRADVAGDENAVLCEARDQLIQLCKDIVADE